MASPNTEPNVPKFALTVAIADGDKPVTVEIPGQLVEGERSVCGEVRRGRPAGNSAVYCP
ncbi:MAG: hypothetical protein R3B91_11025 [Planctomycetaceae bacterium]